MGATVEEGWLAFESEDGEVSCPPGVGVGVSEPLTSGLTRFGLVMGIADLATVLEAIAFALAR